MKHLSVLITLAVLLVAANASMSQTLQTNAAARASSDPAIVGKLREIVTIRQKLAEINERAVQNGKGETDGRYELALAEARLQLARELGQRDEELAALEDTVKVQQRRLQEAKKRAEVGAASPDETDTIRVAVLDAEVSLLRAQNSSKKP
jgi:hypothetical protein